MAGQGLLSGCWESLLVAVGLLQVVRRGDQSPLWACGRPAAVLETVDAPVEPGVSEHRLDHAFAFAVGRASSFAFKDASHEPLETAIPARTGAFAFA